jgi:hypothetical protein
MIRERLRRRPPPLVALAAAATALVGLGAAWIIGDDPRFATAGLLIVVLAVGLWQGFGWARPAAVVVGVGALLPLGWGIYGLAVVGNDWLSCADGRLAVSSIVVTSYPAGFCATRDWPVAFGTGFALLGVGLIGLLIAAAVVGERRYFARGPRLPS